MLMSGWNTLYDVIQRMKNADLPMFWNLIGIAIIICGIICGMAFVHSVDSVYRDLKPSNMLIDHVGRC
jgi:serine/threonine protein kinase